MPQANPLIAETERRLIHLRSMPETPMRRREILSLERVLQIAPRQDPATTKVRRVVKRKETVEEYEPEIEDTTPLKRVESIEGRKRIIIRTPRKEEVEPERDPVLEARAEEKRKKDIQALIRLNYR